MALPATQRVLATALLALTVLFGIWFHDDRHAPAALAVFALPPLLLCAGLVRGWRLAPFWSGVTALAWFSHGVMSAWSQAGLPRLFGGMELLLALLVIAAASLPGLAARRRARHPG